MKLSIKKMLTMFLVIALMFTFAVPCFADKVNLNHVKPDFNDVDANALTEKSGKILGLITNVAIIASVILLAILGVKYMLGSASEKASYQKSFVPLIVGAVVVMSASAIAKLIFSLLD